MLRLSLGESGWHRLRQSTAFLKTLSEIGGLSTASSRAYHTSPTCRREKSTKSKKPFARTPGFRPLPGSDMRYFEEENNKQAGSTMPRPSRGPAKPPSFKPELVSAPLESDIDEAYARKARAERLERFLTNDEVFHRCACFGIDRNQFDTWSAKFVDAASKNKIERLKPANLLSVLARGGMETFDDFIVNQFFAYLAKEAPDVVKNTKFLREITDLRFPNEWSPDARKVQRRIIMHVGPTNSGKTHNALQRMRASKSGIYCSPLRLLAHEVYSRLLADGIPCVLITGEDRRMPDFAELGIEPSGYTVTGRPISKMVSCTVEMAPNVHCHVAVIDEIQMIADRSRGWAWTYALLNMRADEIHLCGEPSAVPLVKRICASLDEEVEVHEYSRLGKLEVSPDSLEGKWSNVQKGDCVVAFSRKDIFHIKSMIEEATGLRCAVIYGGLPPETRAEQARLFNDPDSGYDVLVASDAVGMGINLTINRVVFTTLSKWDGNMTRPISVSQTRQIGGRAGRHNSGVDGGKVTTLVASDIKNLDKTMGLQPHQLRVAGLKPPAEVIEVFSRQFPKVPFSQLWSMFRDIANVSDDYFLCNFRDQEAIASAIGHLGLSIKDMYQFIYAPINCRDEIVKDCLVVCATAVARKTECKAASAIRLPRSKPKSRKQLLAFEQWHRAITMYLWLTFHFPETFTQYDEALVLKSQCEDIIKAGLLLSDSPDKTKHSSDSLENTHNTESGDTSGSGENKSKEPKEYVMRLEAKLESLNKLRKMIEVS
ncbi:RNA helicase [Coemansia sp. S2]|nr:RNA helicase [Coemansia sp. S2]